MSSYALICALLRTFWEYQVERVEVLEAFGGSAALAACATRTWPVVVSKGKNRDATKGGKILLYARA